MLAKSYKDLLVWQKGIELTMTVYSASKYFPSEEKYGLTSQINRASVSVPANIAEGFGRWGPSEFARFLRISLGSVFEVQTHIEIAYRLDYVTEDVYSTICKEALCLEKMLNSLIKKVMSKHS